MVSQGTVYNVKQRYFTEGLDGALYDKPRSGRLVVKTTGEIEANLLAITCSAPPEGQARWTLRLLADKLVELEVVDEISYMTVGSTLKKEIKPWRVKSWCMPKPSARFVAQMEDVLEVYRRPHDPKRPQVCVDEIEATISNCQVQELI